MDLVRDPYRLRLLVEQLLHGSMPFRVERPAVGES